MIGESPKQDWSEDEVQDISTRSWNALKTVPVTLATERISADEELQEDRDKWISSFKEFDAGLCEWLEKVPNGLEKYPLNEHRRPMLDMQIRRFVELSRVQQPTLAERQDLMLRYV